MVVTHQIIEQLLWAGDCAEGATTELRVECGDRADKQTTGRRQAAAGGNAMRRRKGSEVTAMGRGA